MGNKLKLRALAVTTARRLEVLPNIPTVAEFIPNFEASAWYGIGVPMGTFLRGIEAFFYWVGADQERYKYPM